MNAFVIIHFGDKKKYLELEMFFFKNLREKTNNDIIYMYSVIDTPKIFVDIIGKYCDHVIPYDDNNITYNIKFSSFYTHFNTIRTCNFIFTYQLIQYKKLCIIESDMIVINNIDEIFDLKIPSVLILQEKHKANILENYKLDINIDNYEKININGGIMLLEPSLEKFNICLEKIKKITEKSYTYPNETLFLSLYDYVYNLPYKYNGTKFQLNLIGIRYNIDVKKYMSVIHLNAGEHKHIDIIRDNYLPTLKKRNEILYYFINIYKQLYYDKNHEEIEKIINSI